MGHEKTDPILLTAVVTFCYDLFECEDIRFDEEKMKPFHEVIKNMEFMMPYLGFHMYPRLLEMTRRYHNAHKSEKVTDSGSPLEPEITQKIGVNEEDTDDEDARAADQAEKIKKSL